MVSRNPRRFSAATASFLIVLVISTGALVLQSYIHIETYAALNNAKASVRYVEVRFVDDRVETNLTVTVFNPSVLNKMMLKSVRMTAYLNDERLRYTSGQFFYAIEIPSGGFTTVVLHFEIVVDEEIAIYQEANDLRLWNWFFDGWAIVAVAFKEARIDASGYYQGVQIVP